MTHFQMRIDLNVLNHLGLNLYSNVPAVLSEVVANAWDADAQVVRIDLDSSEKTIIIQDDGHGMTAKDVNDKYLIVGRARRDFGETHSQKFRRPVMGRKGIGKLSLFSIANVIELYTIKEGEKSALRMDANAIRNQIKSSDSVNQSEKFVYEPEVIESPKFEFSKGTKIILRNLKRSSFKPQYVRRKLARRFSIIGEANNFQIIVNGQQITIQDRDYYHKIEYLWYYGNRSKSYQSLAKNAKQTEFRECKINGYFDNGDEFCFEVEGWLGLVEKSGSLQVENDDNINKIVLLMRGKLADEDLLEDFREGGLYTKYLFGEIKADFLDMDELDDIATSSRQSIIEDEPRYKALKEFIQSELKHIQTQRAKYKKEEGTKDALKFPAIKDWYNSLGQDTKKRAQKIFGKINQIAADDKHKKQLFVHSVLAFESLRYRDALDNLDDISLDNFEEFIEMFKDFDDIEASLYYKITKERLAIIEKLKEKVHDENALEKILQEYLYNYLWLLDPSWDRATETPYMEQQVAKEFGVVDTKILNEEERKGRLDIKYKKASGKHVIIELKRASVKTSTYRLQEQVDKYRKALRKLLRETNPHEPEPAIETICVVGKAPTDWETPQDRNESIQSMNQKQIRVVTYQQLIEDAYSAYREYLEKNKESGRIVSLIKRIEDEEYTLELEE